MADEDNPGPVTCCPFYQVYGAGDSLYRFLGPEISLKPGAWRDLKWCIPDTGGAPIAEIGLELRSARRADGVVYVDYLTWEGAPDVLLTRPATGGTLWRRAWVDAVDQFESRWPEPYRIIQNCGTGLLMQGTREWTDYRVSAAVTPHLVKACGIAARVQGMRRYYALLLSDDRTVRLVKALDGEAVLAESAFGWSFGARFELSLSVVGQHLQASAGGQLLFAVTDSERPLTGGGVALVCTEGCLSCDEVRVTPAG